MELGKEFHMKVEEKRKIYNFAERTKAKKWAYRDETNGTVMAAETLAAANQCLSWSRTPKLSKNYPQLQSASKAPDLSSGMFWTYFLKKPTKKNRSKWGRKIMNTKNTICRKFLADLHHPARKFIWLTSDDLFVLDSLYVFQHIKREL